MKEVRTILLGLLQRGELYGYQIKKILEQDLYGAWARVPVASLYHELPQMADEGLVERAGTHEAQGRPARIVYRITDKGRDELARLVREAWAQPEVERSSQDIAAFFMHALPEAELLAAVKERLARLHDEQTNLETLARLQIAQDDTPTTARAVIEHARTRLMGEIDWTSRLMADIEAGVYAPPPPRKAVPEASGFVRSGRGGVGAFTFVLHSHIPYCRMAGRWPHGEEWIHEAAAETYIPLLNALYDLRDEGVQYHLTTSITPVLAEQLADQDVAEHFVIYLEEEISRASADIPRFGEEDNPQLEFLARWYRDWFSWVLETFRERFSGDIIGAYRRLQDEGYIEIVTSGATHGYLPLLSRDSSVFAQLRAGVESYRRHFGRAPRAIWLPECAYRPAYIDADSITRPAIEEFLASLGVTCFFVETHAIEGGRPVGKAAGDVSIGPYAAIHRRYVVPTSDAPGTGGTTFQPYYVVGSAQGITEPPVAAMGRNNRTGQQVWSADWGYPGEADYREFHKKDHESGMQYWRVTGPRVDLGSKDY